MKAAVMNPQEGRVQLVDLPNPIATNSDEVLIRVLAAAIKHIDRSKASGTHYSSETHNIARAQIIGGDGIGLLADGTRVYGIGVSGMAAEQAVVHKDRLVAIPDNLDNATAAALPNAIIGAAMGLRFRAAMQPGDTVLINGATGFTGRVAVQIARYYGAKKIIATGRNAASLTDLLALGADEIISVQQDDDTFVDQLRAIHRLTPIDIVIDYLWGHSAELVLQSLPGKGAFTHPTRFVSVGSMMGDILPLSAANLRSVDLRLVGSGLGSFTRHDVHQLFTEILPEMFLRAADGKLTIETVSTPLNQIESIYDQAIPSGKRLVIDMV